MQVNIQGNKADISMLLVSAVRYALGRRTYIVGWTCDFVINNINLLTDGDKQVVINDILNYKKKNGNIGMKYDEEQWLRLKAVLEQEIESFD